MKQQYLFSKWLDRTEGVAGGGVCLKGTGVLAAVVAGMFAAGDSLDFLAKQYDVPRQSIDAAVRFMIYVHGTSLWSKRALAKIEQAIPITKF